MTGIENDALLLRSIKFERPLAPVTPELFSAGWANVAFERDALGHISGFRYGRKDEPMAHFRRAP